METTVEKPTQVGLGFATHSDAFQCGREAAQQAKNQLPEGSVDLVLIFGPGSVHFKDFIEGVRLVMGEETLVAVPCSHVLSNEAAVADACFVAALHTPSMRISLASDETNNGNSHQSPTALLTQFRRNRGNTLREFKHRGSLVFAHQISEHHLELPQTLAADLGLENWLIGTFSQQEKNTALYCTNKSVARGLLGIEFLSQHPFGIGSVAIGPFSSKPDMVREALKSAVREATQQLQSRLACFGLVFFDSGNDAAPLPKDILASAAAVLPQVPLLGISGQHNFVRRAKRSMPAENDSIVVLLVPA